MHHGRTKRVEFRKLANHQSMLATLASIHICYTWYTVHTCMGAQSGPVHSAGRAICYIDLLYMAVMDACKQARR